MVPFDLHTLELIGLVLLVWLLAGAVFWFAIIAGR
jgi:hypothetical protein